MNYAIHQLFNTSPFSLELRALNSLLSAEITAVETYNMAIQKVKDVSLLPTLVQCRNSHALSVERLRKRICQMGGTPVRSSGLFGGLAKLAEGGASSFNDEAAIAILVGTEAFGVQEYKSHMKALDLESFNMVQQDMFRAQVGTRRAINLIYARVWEQHRRAG